MDFFGGSKKKKTTSSVPPGHVIAPQWAVKPNGKFHRLVDLDPEELKLTGQGGVYVVWHGGVRPAWVYVGSAPDLASAMHSLARNDDLMHYDLHGGLFVSWAFLHEDIWNGVLLFLKMKLNPTEDNPDVPTEPNPETGLVPVAVVPPGMHLKTPEETDTY